MSRSADELADVADPAWPALAAAFAVRPGTTVLPVTRERGLSVLHRLQVTARSAMGAVALNSGGVLFDAGWLRLLGGGSPDLADLASANALAEPTGDSSPPPRMVVGFDVLGGQFAVDGAGSLGDAPGEVCYFGPDTLAWQTLAMGYGDFVAWVAGGGTIRFYAELRWPGWEEQIGSLRLDEGLNCYPPLFTEEGRDPAKASRRPVPFAELLALQEDILRQLPKS